MTQVSHTSCKYTHLVGQTDIHHRTESTICVHQDEHWQRGWEQLAGTRQIVRQDGMGIEIMSTRLEEIANL